MPLKPHPTDPDKMVFVSHKYNLPDTPSARAYLDRVLDDDDIQVYKRPWVGLTFDEKNNARYITDWKTDYMAAVIEYIETKLKKKNA